MASTKKTTKKTGAGSRPRRKKTIGQMTVKQFVTVLWGTLTREQYELLEHFPYETPGFVAKNDPHQKTILKLIKLGLLERNPDTKHIVRCTDRGDQIRQQYTGKYR